MKEANRLAQSSLVDSLSATDYIDNVSLILQEEKNGKMQ